MTSSGEHAGYADLPDGFHPFWFWNDRITEAGIREQVRRMADQGIKGFFVHSRQGLAQPYLSSAFFDLVEVAFAAAGEHGLTVHLYDEYPYPSGSGGGAVVQSDPALAGTKLVHTSLDLTAGAQRVVLPAGRALACLAYPRGAGGAPDWTSALDLAGDVGMSLTRQSYHETGTEEHCNRRFFADAPAPVLETTLPAGEWQLCVVSAVPIAGHKYWGSFPDVMNPQAIERFLEVTHERYRRRLGERLGGAASMFVDEVEPVLSLRLAEELAARHARDAPSFFVALYEPTHPRHLAARREAEELMLERFTRSFEQPISRWCRAHHLRYLGEKPSLRLSQLKWMDVPGCEPGHTKAGAPRSDLLQPDIRGNAKATASAAYLYGKTGSLCECYHSLGWGATLQDAKLIAESLLLLGTRWLVPHAFFYSTHGLRKHDAPPSFFQMPYWRHFGELSRRVDAIGAELAGTWVDAKVGVVEPSGGLPDGEQLACYETLLHRLMATHRDFLVVDLDVLAGADTSGGAVCLGDVSLPVIVVPPMQDVEADLARFLDRFATGGGTVVRVADAADVERAVEAVTEQTVPSLGLDAVEGDGAAVHVVSRRGPGGRKWLLVNTAAAPVTVELRAAEGGRIAPVPLDRHATTAVRRRDPLVLSLSAFESVLVAADRGPQASPAARHFVAAADGEWALALRSPNLLRLGRWRLSLPGSGERSAGEQSAVVEPAPIANQLLHSRLPFTPEIVDRFGVGPSIGLPPLRVRYETSFECESEAELALVMEPESLTGEWRLWVDGAGPFDESALRPCHAHVEGCVGIELTDAVLTDAVAAEGVAAEGVPHGTAPHRHTVVVEASLRRGDEGLRDAVFVAGSFGVWAPRRGEPEASGQVAGEPVAGEPVAGEPAGATPVPVLALLTPLAKTARLGTFEESGLPYFAGEVEYSRRLSLQVPEQAETIEVELLLPEGCEDAAELALGDGRFHPLPWSPRRVRLPAGGLASGEAVCRVRLLTTLARPFEGRWFDTRAHAYRPVELAEAPPPGSAP